MFLTNVPQDSETSLEAVFKSEGKPAGNFTHKNDNIYASKCHYRQIFKVHREKKKKGILKENVESDEELVY